MVDYAAEVKVQSDGEVECEEITKYDKVQDNLANGTYHEGVSYIPSPSLNADFLSYCYMLTTI